MNNRTVIDFARLLLRKGLPFCIYRFPGEAGYGLSVSGSFLNGEPDFVIAPFVEGSAAPTIRLKVMDCWADDFFQTLNGLPDRQRLWPGLPAETTRTQYFARIGSFLDDMRAGKLQKAILSRVMWVQKPVAFDSFSFFELLCTEYPDTFVHHFFTPENGVWMGASPETLLIRDHSRFITMALAGTQPRTAAPYFWRPKELEEHELVGKHIEEVFKGEALGLLKKDGPKTVEAGKVAHLRTDYEFVAHSVSSKDLLPRLHPTPAIGGFPVDKGVECILKYEGYDRKYYCGYIGVDDGSSKTRLYINLRNVQEGEDYLAVFVGGGITAASNPEEEWNETIQKSLTMREKLQAF